MAIAVEASDTGLNLKIPTTEVLLAILGQHDQNLKIVEEQFEEARILVRGNEIRVEGVDGEKVVALFEELARIAARGDHLEESLVLRTIEMVKAEQSLHSITGMELARNRLGKPIRPKTLGQRRYVDAINSSTITFGIGPAGTGKSYLAVALAMSALQERKVNRIILTRPAVEAGERLGFLPGDLTAKVDPYLRPLYDALYDLADPDTIAKLFDRQVIEVAPLAFMRGRTLNSSFIILDEAQNTTVGQMKMFLTRIGFGSKAVVTGDVTQVDLPDARSGLLGVEDTLSGIEGISFVRLNAKDVVRNPIVTAIVEAYERREHGANS